MRIVSVAALMLTGACAALPDEGQMTATEAEALYTARWERLHDRTGASGLAGYDILKRVPGAAQYASLPKADAARLGVSTEALLAAQAYAEASQAAALMVWKDGALVAEFYFGETDRESLIISRSLAKPLSVIAVGRAVAEGCIASIDDPVADYIEEWRGTPKAQIRVRDLLSMHSGLLPQAPAPDKNDILNRAYLHPFHDEIIINEYPMVADPGTIYSYSNASGDLLAPLIERATGQAYEDWLSREVFEPLGAMGGDIWMNRDGGTPHAGCCILLPAETYMRLGILLLQGGEWQGTRLLTPEFVEAMKTPGADFPSAGMGLYLGTPYREWRGASGDNETPSLSTSWHSEPYVSDDLFLFDGNSNQVVYMVPSQELVILRVGARAPAEPRWDNAYLPNLILRDIQGQD